MLGPLVAIVLQAGTLASAKPDPDFNLIKTFRCELGDGEGRDYTKQPPTNRRGDKFGEVIFDSVDYRNRSARLIGNVGSETVSLIDGDLAVTFIETTQVGGVNMTTIFKAGGRLGTFKAAISRHVAYTFGGYAVTQYYGTCRGLL